MDPYLSFCTFSIGHCVVCFSSIYRFWLPLWYFQTLFREELCYKYDNRHVPFVVVTITSISTFRGLSSDFEQEWHDGATKNYLPFGTLDVISLLYWCICCSIFSFLNTMYVIAFFFLPLFAFLLILVLTVHLRFYFGIWLPLWYLQTFLVVMNVTNINFCQSEFKKIHSILLEVFLCSL